jgi:hypothetical protein
MAIFNSYVKLPEGIPHDYGDFSSHLHPGPQSIKIIPYGQVFW